jgi:hypothetical protein
MKKESAMREFLVQHGWAVLVVLITFSLVLYIQNNADECTLGDGLTCVDLRVMPTGLSIVVHNDLDQDITIQQVLAGECRIQNAVPLDADEVATIDLEGCSFGAPGSRITSPLAINYANQQGDLVQEKGSVGAFIEVSK